MIGFDLEGNVMGGPGSLGDEGADIGSPTGSGSNTEFYLDETPAFQPQIDSSAAKKERQRTMGARMGGGPSYGAPLSEANDWENDADAAAWGHQLTNWMRSTRLDPVTGKKITGYKNPVWKPEFANWSAAKKADWMAGFDKTLGAAAIYSENKKEWEDKATLKDQQAIWGKVSKLMDKFVHNDLDKFIKAGYNNSQITSLLDSTSNLRDIIRHGIATNKYGLVKMTAYEMFKSGGELSDYKNNLAADLFASKLSPGQDFDEEWAKAVIQEKMNPGSTGLDLNWKAGTSDDPTLGDWWAGLWEGSIYDKGGFLGNPKQGAKGKAAWEKLALEAVQPGGGQGWINPNVGMITQVEGQQGG